MWKIAAETNGRFLLFCSLTAPWFPQAVWLLQHHHHHHHGADTVTHAYKRMHALNVAVKHHDEGKADVLFVISFL